MLLSVSLLLGVNKLQTMAPENEKTNSSTQKSRLTKGQKKALIRIAQWEKQPQQKKDNALRYALNAGNHNEAWELLQAGADILKTGW